MEFNHAFISIQIIFPKIFSQNFSPPRGKKEEKKRRKKTRKSHFLPKKEKKVTKNENWKKKLKEKFVMLKTSFDALIRFLMGLGIMHFEQWQKISINILLSEGEGVNQSVGVKICWSG